MRETFDAILPRLFADEGPYCNDEGDPGGPTKWGIIYADLVAWRGAPAKASLAARVAAVKTVDQAEAAAIYRAKYWQALHCDEMPAGVDYAVFDYGVNSGISRAARYLQDIVGAKPDGIVGGMTLAAVARMDPETIVSRLCARRMSFLQGLANWRRFGRGWKARVLHVAADALLMARAARTAPVPAVAPPEVTVAVTVNAAPLPPLPQSALLPGHPDKESA